MEVEMAAMILVEATGQTSPAGKEVGHICRSPSCWIDE
jgi:hypothetical protein